MCWSKKKIVKNKISANNQIIKNYFGNDSSLLKKKFYVDFSLNILKKFQVDFKTFPLLVKMFNFVLFFLISIIYTNNQ